MPDTGFGSPLGAVSGQVAIALPYRSKQMTVQGLI